MKQSDASFDNDNRGPDIISVLIAVSKKTRTILGLRLAEIGLSAGEDEVLLALVPDQAMTVAALSTSLGTRGPTIGRTVERLAGQGFLERQHGSVQLTPAGIALQARVVAVRRGISDDIGRTVDVSPLGELAVKLSELDDGLAALLQEVT